MQLKVIKSDGTTEVYLHTKVMGAIAAALDACDYFEPHLAERLAEAVTTFVKRRYGCGEISSDEVHSMIKVVLSDVGFEIAALRLHEHRIERQVKRHRLQVVRFDTPIARLPLSELPQGFDEGAAEPWNKSRISDELQQQYRVPRAMARAVAAAVEEKVLRLGLRTVSTDLLRTLVADEMIAFRQAEHALEQTSVAAAEAAFAEPLAALA